MANNVSLFSEDYFTNYNGIKKSYRNNYKVATLKWDSVLNHSKRLGFDLCSIKTFLDVGAADGSVMRAFSQNGLDVKGIEFSPHIEFLPDMADKIIRGDALDPRIWDVIPNNSINLMYLNLTMYMADEEVLKLLNLCAKKLANPGLVVIPTHVMTYNPFPRSMRVVKNKPFYNINWKGEPTSHYEVFRSKKAFANIYREHRRTLIESVLVLAAYDDTEMWLIKDSRWAIETLPYQGLDPLWIKDLGWEDWPKKALSKPTTLSGWSSQENIDFPVLVTFPNGFSLGLYLTKRGWVEGYRSHKRSIYIVESLPALCFLFQEGYFGPNRSFRLNPVNMYRYVYGVYMLDNEDGTYTPINDHLT